MRRFTKPPESLERSLELSRHRGRKRTQKRPNYKNLGEEDDDERAGGGGGSGSAGGLEEGWDDDGRGGEREGGRDREKGKGTEGGGGGSSKGSRASGETAEGEFVSHWTQQYRNVFVSVSLLPSVQHSHVPWLPNNHRSSSPRLQTEKRETKTFKDRVTKRLTGILTQTKNVLCAFAFRFVHVMQCSHDSCCLHAFTVSD